MSPRILVVDDDAHIRDVLRFALEDAGMQITEAGNGVQALSGLAGSRPDLVVLDVGMPEMDGFDTCKAIRQRSAVPILFLTARDDEIDRVLGFQLGGDDYVAKPFSPRELVLRIRAILARAKAPAQTDHVIRHNDLHMDKTAHLCLLGEAELQLTPIEFSVLLVLVRSPEQVRSRAALIGQVYGQNSYLSDRTVDSHIRNIRTKARDAGYDDVIQTVHGIGVKLGTCTR